ncbi:zinc chelation protein SecC [Clostridium botulinum]|uniref:SEC-C metal-binding domain-containing protein n=1 Tax=Clostridium botulinum TaxID=1491 RepID=UPI0013CAFC4D|nr:SEC-C metal-binding domain-containing protein [Clostridium botulinum]MBN1076390.1 zinc chelation protein SecC [Clostridium botulinum]MBY6838287.1 SEC-C domain-containing protein [Clostridium botulinum]NFG65032.1 zinc chelation protein SecC [Clostridium botulinum]NFN18076.1 zinc chelation protein SecC [Clostridium botulinum]NFN49908.1 zinc chelation protein SecC [Clostridium botulinum]
MVKKECSNKDTNNEFIENKETDESAELYDDMMDDLFQKYENKMNKMFVKGVYSFEVSEQLKSLSKDAVYNIAKNLGMSKISTLNKDALIEKVLNEYTEIIANQFIYFEEERFNILKSYLNNDGVKIFDDIDEYELSRTAYFMQQGIIFPSTKDEKAVFLMPKIVQDIIINKDTTEYIDILKRNKEVLDLYRGLNKAYGIVNNKDVTSLLQRYDIENSDEFSINEIIKEAQYYYREYREEKGFFINNNVENWSDLLKDIEKNNKDLEYYNINKNELLDMIGSEWIYKSKFGKSFLKEFTNIFEIKKDMVYQIMDDLSFDIQDNGMDDTINSLLELINANNLELRNHVKGVVTKFLSNIRLWKYRGATINEISGNITEFKPKITIGRNDPCVCGSGKKYKKCCGKN